MSDVVIDASFAAAWVLPDESNERVDAVFNRLDAWDGRAPAIWPTEIANTLLIAERRGRLSTEDTQGALLSLRLSPIVVEDVDRDQTWINATQLAREHGLTVYDASYLELALRLSLPLATLDKRLAKAAENAGVSLA